MSWPHLLPQVGFTRLAADYYAEVGQARLPTPSTSSLGRDSKQDVDARDIGVRKHAVIFPILQQAATNGESIAAVVARVPVWPQLLVTLIGSRVLATESKLSFAWFWHRPTERRATVEIQSIPSAIACS